VPEVVQVLGPPPPGAATRAWLAAIIAERRRRDTARLNAARVPPGFGVAAWDR
jgi:hypothetical protein